GKNRTIALADKIMPIMKRLYGDGTKKQLILTPKGKTMTPATFKHYWRAKMQELGIERGLHEARHTCVSNLYKVGVAPEIIRKQVGHSGKSVTESVYLHIGVEQLLEAVNKLD
ncbi:MAG: tyrosine-type recombinase/integrase, partial [Paludibacteraceae bacterium]|nr:tyrosine-type recombinase/integrase [Paludibacteraceae bacterium]